MMDPGRRRGDIVFGYPHIRKHSGGRHTSTGRQQPVFSGPPIGTEKPPLTACWVVVAP